MNRAFGGYTREAASAGPGRPFSAAGFVLTGGASTRMGRDKALLPIEGSTLVECTAEKVRAAAGSVTLIGAPERYAALGIPALADEVTGCGPIGGVYTALKHTATDWNLIVACDMPGIDVRFLSRLLAAAHEAGALCLAPRDASGLHPLCAVYHRRSLAHIESAIAHNQFQMQELLNNIGAAAWPVDDSGLLTNVNTPSDFTAANSRGPKTASPGRSGQ
jgi:molybdopterin-guanine dinucleotide biosynthesis protein A